MTSKDRPTQRGDGPSTPSVEVYSLERKAAFLLTNATDAEDYARAREAVHRMGLDPGRLPGKP
jgi:hypothetical protein